MTVVDVVVLVVLTVVTVAAGGECVYFGLGGSVSGAGLAGLFTVMGFWGGAVFWTSSE